MSRVIAVVPRAAARPATSARPNAVADVARRRLTRCLATLTRALAVPCVIAALALAPHPGTATAYGADDGGRGERADYADYALQPVAIAEDTWVVVGRTEDFTPANGGNIANAAFIDTGDGVIVIDTGATWRYGQALRQAIARVTASPIRAVWNTHHHPDHFLGNQAFAELPIAALPATREGIRTDGNAFADNVYRMAGDWAKGTEVVAPSADLVPGTRRIGHHEIRILALSGHTDADLAIFDATTGVLITGDLAFHERAPTTPHADIERWLASLDTLAALPYRVLVPGHGRPTRDDTPLAQTRRWLTWLDAALRRAADEGLDAAEVLALPMPDELARLPLARSELTRSLAHLYRRMETRAVTRQR